MRSNQRVKFVDPDCEDENEIKRDNLKVEILNTYDKFINKNCNNKGEIKSENNPVKVLNGIKDKVICNKINVIPTDKTNRLSVIPPNVYKESMEEHHKDDKVITKRELNKVERELHDHSKSITKIFKIGFGSGQQKRALANATVHINGQVPVMKGAEKDHKQNEDKIKMRPIVNAMDGPKKNVSDTFSDLLSAVIEANNDEVLCYSTEELLEAFKSYNEDRDENRYIIGSMVAVPELKSRQIC